MTSISYVEPELLIALEKRVIFVNPDDLQIFKEVELPQDLKECGLRVAQNNGVNHTDNVEAETINNPDKYPQKKPSIQHVALSSDGQLLAITTAGQKAVLLYRCRAEHAMLLSTRNLQRTSSALTFNRDSTMLLVTDKTGDCYQYDCQQAEAEPKLLLGHLSIVYDVLWTPDMKYIITCDRDDKIRVSNYPETYDIHAYCLGHKEFVSGMSLLADNVLVSVSGDKTLRLWNYLSGKELTRFELPAPAIRLAVRRGRLEAGEYLAAVQLHQTNESLGIYRLMPPTDEADNWQIMEIELQSYPNMIVSNFCFVHDRLYVAGSVNKRFSMNVTPPTQVPTNWLAMVEEQFKDVSLVTSDVSAWFKKRYDNVSDYLERKKRRIEEHQTS